MAFGATSEENKELDRYFSGGNMATANMLPAELIPGPTERGDANVAGLLCTLAYASIKAYGHAHAPAMEEITAAVQRARALESFWSAWKDVEASGVGYSASFTEAAKRLKEMEG